MPSIRLVETHPPIPSHKTFSGRGGYGNVIPLKDVQTSSQQKNASGFPSLTPSSTCESCTASSSSHFSTGRGGSGNFHNSSIEQAIFSFDEELEQEARIYAKAKVTPIYTTVGRGGAGNVCSTASTNSTSNGKESLSPVQAKQLRDSYLEHYREVERIEAEQRRRNRVVQQRRREQEEKEKEILPEYYSDDTEIDDTESECPSHYMKLGQGKESEIQSQATTSVATQLTNSLKNVSRRTLQRFWGGGSSSSSSPSYPSKSSTSSTLSTLSTSTRPSSSSLWRWSWS